MASASAKNWFRNAPTFARTTGYKRIVLWTQSTLTAARKLYVGEGYQLIKQEPHRSFGKDLVGETWELRL